MSCGTDARQNHLAMEIKMFGGDSKDGLSRILSQVVTLIRQRGYEPGDRIPSEREFAERLNVGRTQVREAMTMLEAMRYLEKRRGSGVFLCKDKDTTSLEALVLFAQLEVPVDPKINQQCVEVRRIIEVQAIRMACARRTEADLAALDAVLGLFRDDDDFVKEAAEYDYSFHLTLLKAADNDILVRLVNPFYLMSDNRRQAFFNSRERCLLSHRQHEAILKAVRERNSDEAERLLAAHIGRVKDYFQTS